MHLLSSSSPSFVFSSWPSDSTLPSVQAALLHPLSNAQGSHKEQQQLPRFSESRSALCYSCRAQGKSQTKSGVKTLHVCGSLKELWVTSNSTHAINTKCSLRPLCYGAEVLMCLVDAASVLQHFAEWCDPVQGVSCSRVVFFNTEWVWLPSSLHQGKTSAGYIYVQYICVIGQSTQAGVADTKYCTSRVSGVHESHFYFSTEKKEDVCCFLFFWCVCCCFFRLHLKPFYEKL